MKKETLGHVAIINRSGYKIMPCDITPVVKSNNYKVISGKSISGDAPKKFIQIYSYTAKRKAPKKNSWKVYIAKTGHKHYPGESVTEYLLNQVGCVLGMNMAVSRLVFAHHQLRFLSEFFLPEKNLQLVHGAEIFSGYFNDEAYVLEVERKGEARRVFTIEVVQKAIEHLTGENAAEIFKNFVKMLLFDAWVGNNDRHFYNWGIVMDIYSIKLPYFAPIYDTARGLFWNFPEKKIIQLFRDKNALEAKFKKYSRDSRPKTGINGDTEINHFDLIKHLYENSISLTKNEFKLFITQDHLSKAKVLIDTHFSKLFTRERRHLIKEYLEFRYNKIINIFI